jgi:cysteinyl-tRNA synthetase
MKILQQTKQNIHEALCDNFNTALVLKNLKEVISKTYEYETKSKTDNSLKLHVIYNVSQYVAYVTKCLGLIYRTEFIEYFIFDSEGMNNENLIAPYIEVLAKFRDQIKTAASVDKDLVKILKICDEVRDDILPYLGVKIEDKGKGNVFKFILN